MNPLARNIMSLIELHLLKSQSSTKNLKRTETLEEILMNLPDAFVLQIKKAQGFPWALREFLSVQSVS